MASHRERVVQAIFDLLHDGLRTDDCKPAVSRNRDRPQSVDAAGDVIIRDGDPGEPEVSLSPPRYFWNHRIPVEVAYRASDKEGGLDRLLGRIGDLIEVDPTLGGLCQYIEASAPVIDISDAAGASGARWADFEINAQYLTTRTL